MELATPAPDAQAITLAQMLAAAARRFADRTAVHTGTRRVSFRELDAAASEFARRLHPLGLDGRRAGLLLPNVPEFPACFFGILRAGAGVVLLNPLYSPRETAEYAADAGVDTVVTVRALSPLLPANCRAVLLDAPLGFPDPNVSGAAAAAEAVVIYTSAMDGWGRGARLSHANLLANLRSTVQAMQLVPDDRVVAALPLIHSFGLTVTLNAALCAGASVIPVDRFNPVRMLEMFEAEQPTVFCGVPAMYLGLLAAAERKGVPAHRLRVAICGGAPLPHGVAERWQSVFGLPLREGYGLTEGAPVCLFNRVDRPNRPGTLGSPFPGVAVSVRDAHGTPVPTGRTGELCVAGANVFEGYIGDTGRDPRCFWGDAFRTGDLASEEPDGTFRFRGIRKAMFTRSGFNIYPREIERVLEQDPRIGRAEVRAVPDPARENEVALVVHPAAGASLSQEDVQRLCRAQLAAFKQPATISIAS